MWGGGGWGGRWIYCWTMMTISTIYKMEANAKAQWQAMVIVWLEANWFSSGDALGSKEGELHWLLETIIFEHRQRAFIGDCRKISMGSKVRCILVGEHNKLRGWQMNCHYDLIMHYTISKMAWWMQKQQQQSMFLKRVPGESMARRRAEIRKSRQKEREWAAW